MGIPYTTGIPAASHNPSSDQPDMQENTNSIASALAVDHVAFNTTGTGRHNQVTFNSNNVPSTPTSPPVLFTNTVGSFPQLFFYSGSTTNQYAISNPGGTLTLGGIIIKWGSSGSIGVPVAFANAFPNACFGAVVTGTSTLYTGGFVVSGTTTSTITVTRTSGSGSTGYFYIAVGF